MSGFARQMTVSALEKGNVYDCKSSVLVSLLNALRRFSITATQTNVGIMKYLLLAVMKTHTKQYMVGWIPKAIVHNTVILASRSPVCLRKYQKGRKQNDEKLCLYFLSIATVFRVRHDLKLFEEEKREMRVSLQVAHLLNPMEASDITFGFQ